MFDRSLAYGLLAVAAMLAAYSPAISAQSAVKVTIASQSLAESLRELAAILNVNVVANPADVNGIRAPALSGTLTAQQAFAKLLAGTQLEAVFSNDTTISVLPAAAARAATGRMSKQTRMDRPPHIRVANTEHSQQSAAPQSITFPNDEQEKLQEVVVTAQKREERLQDVPISIAVIGNAEIERRGLIGMEDYLRSIPGVNQIDRGADNNAIVIRGVTTAPEFENLYSGTTVASYFDETPITGAAGLGAGGIDIRPVDIERIEVLRGPQGTAYGSASLGGAVRMIPAKPELRGFSGKVAGSYSGTSGSGGENSMIQGVINIPVVDGKLALRAVGYRYDESGFYRNVAGNDPATLAIADSYGLGNYVLDYIQDEAGRMVSTGGRLASLWQPTDNLGLSVTVLTQEIEQDGAPVATTGRYEHAAIPIAPDGRVRGKSGEVADTEMDLASLVLSYDLKWAELTSAVSWVDGGSAYARDETRFYLFPTSTTIASDYRSFSTETRLASRFAGRFQFLGGIFHEDVEDEVRQTYDWPGPPAASPWTTVPGLVYEDMRKLDQRAIFGEVSYDLTDRLTATLGGRYFKYDRSARILLDGGAYGLPIGGGTFRSSASSESGSSFKANLSYKPSEHSLLYASWAEGFRLGQAQLEVPSATCDQDGDGMIDGSPVSIASTRKTDSDSLENYEVGAKVSFLDRRLVIDTSVYHIDWDRLPIVTFAESCGAYYLANAGAATSDGMEMQASLLIARGLQLDLGVGLINAELSKDAPALGAEKGARLPGSPRVSGSLAAQYDFDIVGRKAFARVDSYYAGRFYSNLLQTGVGVGDYIKVDARVGVSIQNISVEVFVRNVTNEDAFTWGRPTLSTPFYGYRLRPRTVGVHLAYSFE